MNTKPKIRRHGTSALRPEMPQGGAVGTINDPDIALALARVVSSFVHLEAQLASPLAELAGCDMQTAGYMLRAIKSPRGRVDLLRELLTKAPRNKERVAAWDELIAEFWRINGRRNAYVHGYWWTHEDGSTWLAEEAEHGISMLAARAVSGQELEQLSAEIGACLLRVVSWRWLIETQPQLPTPPPEPKT